MQTLHDFKDLIRTMQMSHLYKPIMLQAVLKRDGRATKEQIAADIVSRDVLQHEHYRRNVIDKQPGWRLERDGALVKEGETPSERLELIAECERRIEDFVSRYGDKFEGRNDDPVPGGLRYEVLKRAGGSCELCGTPHNEVPLDVDHIMPRSKGGPNDAANLQVLCQICNRQKRDTDDTDFRAMIASYEHRDPHCLFCEKETGAELLTFVIDDGFPVTPGHSLIIPRRHVADYFDLYQAERNAIDRLLRQRRNELRRQDRSITGFNVGVNAGMSAGQTVFHVHVHLIPRRDGDVSNPRGGVRRVIPGKQGY